MDAQSSFLPNYLSIRLLKRKEEDSLRVLKVREGLIDFASNDYLGLARVGSGSVTGLGLGSTGSRLISGNSHVFAEAEKFLASAFESESALLFNSGYDANLGLISSLSSRESVFLFDELSHASIRDGLRLGNGKSYHFRHNNLADLERLLKKNPEAFVVTESVFSMDGDLAPLKAMAELCILYRARLIVDEAHATGILGKHGQGAVIGAGLQKKIFARIYTFGKAGGSHGAMVAGSAQLKEFLINFCRPFIYTTALPPGSVIHLVENVKRMLSADDARLRLEQNISFFNRLFRKEGMSPVRILHVNGGNTAVKKISQALEENGFFVPAILHPTVPAGKERLRICIHSFNTEKELTGLHEVLKNTGGIF